MSERWGICIHCNGTGEVGDKECSICMGTPGYSGHAFEMHLRPKKKKLRPPNPNAIEKAIEALNGNLHRKRDT